MKIPSTSPSPLSAVDDEDPPASDSHGTVSSNSNTGSQVEQSTPQTFEHFADLFDVAAPSTHDQKALVGAYWVQVVKGKSEFQTFDVNKELKQLGHGNSYINKAFDSLTSKKPALALQTRKSGKTQQARKTYKLTTAGVKEVQRMLSNES